MRAPLRDVVVGRKPRRKKNYLLLPSYRRVNLKWVFSLSEEQALAVLHQAR